MKIEAQETVKHHPHYMAPGDIKTVDDETGQYLVDHGWCKNLDTGEIGEREGGPVTLDIDNVAHSVADTGE